MRWWWCVVQMGVATRLFHQHAVDSPPSFQSNSHFLSPRQKRGPFLVIREDILYKITQLHFCKLEAAWIFGCNQNWIQLLSSFRRLRRQILFYFWTQFRAFKSKNDGVLLLLDCKKRLENLKFIHHASTFALKAVSSTTDKNKPQNQQFRQFWWRNFSFPQQFVVRR